MENNPESNLEAANSKVYAGNPWTAGETFVLYFFFFFMSFVFYAKPPAHVFSYVFAFAILVIFFMKASLEMDYFVTGKHQLIVKNHYAPWDCTIINFADIKLLTIEKPQKLAYSLRIDTYDNRSVLYSASSLRNKHWRAFRDDMDAIGIPVTVKVNIG